MTRIKNIALWFYILLPVLLLSGGFPMYLDSILRTWHQPVSVADSVVVFTGGARRIEKAVQLVAAARGARLFISGVHPDTAPSALDARLAEGSELLACCVDLDRVSQNTRDNAFHTANWLTQHNYRSVVLVTSSWHMPRATLLLRAELPYLDIHPAPVWDEVSTPRLFGEYMKYVATFLYAYTRFALFPVEAPADR